MSKTHQIKLSSSGPGPRSGPCQVQKVQGLRTKDLDLGYTLNLVCHHHFEGDLEGDFEGNLEGDLEGNLEGGSKGDFRGDFKQNMEGDLLSSSGQVRSRSGLVQFRSGPGLVQFTAQI